MGFISTWKKEILLTSWEISDPQKSKIRDVNTTAWGKKKKGGNLLPPQTTGGGVFPRRKAQAKRRGKKTEQTFPILRQLREKDGGASRLNEKQKKKAILTLSKGRSRPHGGIYEKSPRTRKSSLKGTAPEQVHKFKSKPCSPPGRFKTADAPS